MMGVPRDVTNQTFGMLKAIRPTDKRCGRTIIWECYCECGGVRYLPVNKLTNKEGKYKTPKSCGCLGEKAHSENGKTTLNKNREKSLFVKGTNIQMISNGTLISNSTTKIRGVSFSKQHRKYEAYITFKYKKYNLGLFDKIEDAAKARKVAEEKIYGNFLEWYHRNHNRDCI